ncbi:hypothetical protein LTR62_002295 [Meristemomyces frigidus]|uniref:F-box domain-containing protein n=1 Tax=Meristemomyces frigidus TaxID=1508187 RepID=A0AAN7TFV3_9PEZI|nr:hypothetical protein LTR62_002295 [Meristemomyces frigidus]
MHDSLFSRLPEELLEAIVSYLPPIDTVAFGRTCRRSNKATYEPLVWRAHCLRQYRHWQPSHEIKEKLSQPPAQVRWRKLFVERKQRDKEALDLFNTLLQTQQHRIHRMEKVAAHGYDVKDVLLQERDGTPDDAEDVLARRYYADAILGQIHRATALEKWTRLLKQQMVRLEEVLGAYDLFVLAGRRGDLDDIDQELDRLAAEVRSQDLQFDTLSIREKAILIARYLRVHSLVGNPSETDYHALRNNFISLALFHPPHTSLPLQSVAIYCAVARRLGVNASPSNYPYHVHAVIKTPSDMTLDGAPRVEREHDFDDPGDIMHMDPWRSETEMAREELSARLLQMGAPPAQHWHHLGPATVIDLVRRTCRNIMNSVQETRDRDRQNPPIPSSLQPPDMDGAWYSSLWAMLLLGDSLQPSTLHRRRQCLPYLIETHQSHFPSDLNLIEKIILPMMASQPESRVLTNLVANARTADSTKMAPSPRPPKDQLRAWFIPGIGGVRFMIGTYFKHRRFQYEGMIVGWDTRCSAEPRWIEDNRVDRLQGGREQPFYHVVAADRSIRYVAEENIDTVSASSRQPSEEILALAGRYFKRWDAAAGRFVSNIRDEYPDD